MKRLIKQTIATGLNMTGIARRTGRSERMTRPPYVDVSILMYHRVVDDFKRDLFGTEASIAVTTDTFERQMAWLKQQCTVIPLRELIVKLDAGTRLPERCAVVTFDDGWRDNFTHAAPILKQYDIPSTIYLSTDYIGSNKLFWFQEVGLLQERLAMEPTWFAAVAQKANLGEAGRPASQSKEAVIAWFKQFEGQQVEGILRQMRDEGRSRKVDTDIERQMLTWDECRQLSSQGVDFGSHGCGHNIFTLLSETELSDELGRSRRVMADQLGSAPVTVAYPNGNCNDVVARAAQAAGYRAGLSTRGCQNLPRELGRYGMVRIGMHEGVTAGRNGCFSAQLFELAVFGPSGI